MKAAGLLAQITPAVIASFLRDRILRGVYRPGQQLSERSLLSELLTEYQYKNARCSRSPLRAAIEKLAAEGLIEKRPKSGTFVHNPSKDEIREVIQTRIGLEEMVARVLASQENDLSEVEKIQYEMADIARLPDFEQNAILRARFFDGNDRFHLKLSELAGFKTTASEHLRQLRNRFRLVAIPRNRSFAAATLREHDSIMRAIRAKKPREAAKMMNQHIKKAVISRWELPEEFKDYLAANLI